MGWLSGWTYRIEIKINHDLIDATLTDFPARVDLPVGDFDFSDARSDGYDIRFTSSDGETLLKYERERHDSTNELARYWVKIPSVSSSADTTFYMYYGKADATDGADPENVWDSDFLAVYHFAQDPTGTVYDSTSNNRDLNDNSGTLTSGDLVDEGGGYAILSDDEYLRTQDHDWSALNTAATLEVFSRNTKITGNWRERINVGVYAPGQSIALKLYNNENRHSVGIYSDDTPSDMPIDIGGGYEYGVIYYDGTTAYVQVECTVGSVSNAVSLSIPNSSKLTTGGNFPGYYSEARVSKIVRPYAWRKATAYNLHGELFVPDAVTVSWLSGFSCRRKITIDKTKIHTPLQNFPVTVDLTSANFDFSKARSDGYDIRFTASDGTTLLYYERERHDSANELARYHVLVPSISVANDTDIYIYYGKPDATDGENATSVWDSDFVAVYHFAQDPTGTVYDSTSNGRNLTAVVSMSSDDLVAQGGGYAIDIANGQSLRTGNYDWSILNSGYTGEFFVNLGSSPDTWGKGCHIGQVGVAGALMVLTRYSSSNKYNLGVSYDDVETSVPYTTGSYIYFASYQTAYGKDIGGQECSFVFKEINITATANTGTSTKLSIGASTDNAGHWPGKYAETRISKITRSRSWRTATYYSFNGELLSLDGEETAPAVSTAISTTLAPTTISPTTVASTTLAPTTIIPTTLAPTTLNPTTLAPTTLAPTTISSTTISPTTVAPTTLIPTTVNPTTIATTTIIPTTLPSTTLAPTTALSIEPVCIVKARSNTTRIAELRSKITTQINIFAPINKEATLNASLCR